MVDISFSQIEGGGGGGGREKKGRLWEKKKNFFFNQTLIKLFKDHDIDYLINACNAAGLSAFHFIE